MTFNPNVVYVNIWASARLPVGFVKNLAMSHAALYLGQCRDVIKEEYHFSHHFCSSNLT